jgi:putative acetyltransferase
VGIDIRRYEDRDLAAVREVHALAFRRDEEPDALPIEVGLFERLLADEDVVPELSLVAVEDDRLVGHVACSWATAGDRAVVGLGPIGVLPDRQGRRIGTRLMEAVLPEADRLGFPLVALLGSPRFYGRFGFVPAASVGVDAPDPAWGDEFQVRTLSRYRATIRGPFRYAPAFDESGAT